MDWDKIIRKEKIRFKYLYYPNRIAATICYRFLDDERTKVQYAITFHNKHDVCTKELGRLNAYVRFKQMEADALRFGQCAFDIPENPTMRVLQWIDNTFVDRTGNKRRLELYYAHSNESANMLDLLFERWDDYLFCKS